MCCNLDGLLSDTVEFLQTMGQNADSIVLTVCLLFSRSFFFLAQTCLQNTDFLALYLSYNSMTDTQIFVDH